MNVHLSNFRCHRNQTFTFSPGLNLIEGKSGQGKTTILDAISWCLLGKQRNVLTRGEKKCSVVLNIDGYQITRTKTPSRLLIAFPSGETLEDDAAQHYVHRLIGGEHFELTSYMLQKGTTQFFTLPALEKRRFIESLAKQHNNLDSIKERIQNKLKSLKAQLLTTETLLHATERDRVHKPEDANLLGLELLSDQKDLLQLNHSIYQRYQKLYSDKKQHLSEQLSAIEMSRKIQSRRQEIEASLSIHRSQLSELPEINFSQESLSTLEKKVSDGLASIEHQKKKSELLQAKRNYEDLIKQEELSIQSQLSELHLLPIADLDPQHLSSLKKNYDSLLRYRDLTSRLPKEVDLTSQQQLVDELKRILSHAQQRKTVIGCPHCNKGLVIKGETITRVDNTPLTIEEKTQLKDATERIGTEEKKLSLYTKQHLLREQMLLERNGLCSDDAVETEYTRLKEIEERNRSALQHNELIQQQILRLKSASAKDKYAVLRKQYEKELEVYRSMPKGESFDSLKELQIELSETREMKSRAEMTEREKEKKRLVIESLQKELAELAVESEVGDVVTLQKECQRYEELVKESERRHVMLKQIGEYAIKRKEYKKWEGRMNGLKERLDILNGEIVSLETFLRKLGEAETKCLEDTIRVVNRKMQEYLLKFFPEEAIRLELATEKESKKGSIKTEIAVRLFYKGEDCDLTSLSGGEYDRCAVAFLMAVNDVSGSRMLILDESIGSLDQTNAENVLEVIKEVTSDDATGYDKVVILVQHQATCGSYDHVVRV